MARSAHIPSCHTVEYRLLACVNAGASALFHSLKLSKKQRSIMANAESCVNALPEISPANEFDMHGYQVTVYRYGKDALYFALCLSELIDNEVTRVANFVEQWEVPVFPVDASMLMSAGVKPGPELGKLLRHLEEDWITAGFQLDDDHIKRATLAATPS